LTTIPWLLALVTALWFGWMARRAERNWVLWGLGGAAFALVTSTIVFGLGQAASIPFSQSQRAALHLEWTVVAVVLIGLLGGLMTLGLPRPPRPEAKPGPPAGNPTPIAPVSAAQAKGQK